MKIEISTIIILLASCCTTNGVWFLRSQRRSEYPRFPSYSRHVFSSPSGRTTFDVGQHDLDDYYRAWAGLEHRADNWNSSNGNHYNITLYVDPCNFLTYDYDRDGTIVKDELHAIFGDSKKADELFADLDVTEGDEGINPEEFNTMAPMIIAACMDTKE